MPNVMTGIITCHLALQQTLGVPNAWNPFQLLKLVPSMIKADRVDFRDLVGVVQLLGLQLVVIFPVAQKLFQRRARCNSHARALGMLRLVRSAQR